MITLDQRLYDYYTFGENDDYGQPQLSEEVSGRVKMAINLMKHTAAENVLFQDCEYIGLTHNAAITDKCIVSYGDMKLKVVFVSPFGLWRQVYMKRME